MYFGFVLIFLWGTECTSLGFIRSGLILLLQLTALTPSLGLWTFTEAPTAKP